MRIMFFSNKACNNNERKKIKLRDAHTHGIKAVPKQLKQITLSFEKTLCWLDF